LSKAAIVPGKRRIVTSIASVHHRSSTLRVVLMSMQVLLRGVQLMPCCPAALLRGMEHMPCCPANPPSCRL